MGWRVRKGVGAHLLTLQHCHKILHLAIVPYGACMAFSETCLAAYQHPYSVVYRQRKHGGSSLHHKHGLRLLGDGRTTLAALIVRLAMFFSISHNSFMEIFFLLTHSPFTIYHSFPSHPLSLPYLTTAFAHLAASSCWSSSCTTILISETEQPWSRLLCCPKGKEHSSCAAYGPQCPWARVQPFCLLGCFC